MKMKNTNETNETYSSKPQDEFIRQVLFLRDDDKILAVFPFYHEISDTEYNALLEGFYDELGNGTPPPKNEFCLINEQDFGWGWIHNKMVTYLEVAEYDEYDEFRNMLVDTKVIRKTFILNEE